jgi:hypothetical protein
VSQLNSGVPVNRSTTDGRGRASLAVRMAGVRKISRLLEGEMEGEGVMGSAEEEGGEMFEETLCRA